MLGEHGGVDAAREIAEFGKSLVKMLSRPLQDAPGPGRVTVQPLVEDREFERGGHQALLRAVVQITLDAPPRGVGGLHQPSPRRRQRLARRGVLDSVRDELVEGGHALLRAHRHRGRIGRRRRQRAPHPPAEQDRPGGRRSDPEPAHQRRDDPTHLVEILDPHRPGRNQHAAENPPALFDRSSMADRHRRRLTVRPRRHHPRPLRTLDTQQRRPLRAEQLPGLAGHGGEDLRR